MKSAVRKQVDEARYPGLADSRGCVALPAAPVIGLGYIDSAALGQASPALRPGMLGPMDGTRGAVA